MALIATTSTKSVEKAALELGDILYEIDNSIDVRKDERYPLVYVFSSVDAMKLFRRLTQNPPAYSHRIVPAEHILEDVHVKTDKDVERLVYSIMSIYKSKLAEKSRFKLYGKPRRYYINIDEKHFNNILFASAKNALAELGYEARPVFRAARYELLIEDTKYGIVVAWLPANHSKASFWRTRRLSFKG